MIESQLAVSNCKYKRQSSPVFLLLAGQLLLNFFRLPVSEGIHIQKRVMNKALVITIILLLSLAVIISCSKDSSDGGGGNTLDCNTVTNKSFSAGINPIIQATCNAAGCHAAGSVNGPGPITNHAQVAASATSIRAAIASGLMPQGTTLSTSQKNSILCWIDSGTPNN